MSRNTQSPWDVDYVPSIVGYMVEYRGAGKPPAYLVFYGGDEVGTLTTDFNSATIYKIAAQAIEAAYLKFNPSWSGYGTAVVCVGMEYYGSTRWRALFPDHELWR